MSQILTQSAREYMDNFAQQLAKSYGVSNVAELFNVSPQLETKLRAAITESAEFLKMITVTTVDQIEGQVVDVGVSGLYTAVKRVAVSPSKWRRWSQIQTRGNRFLCRHHLGNALPVGEPRWPRSVHEAPD